MDAVDVTAADWRNCVARGGDPDRRAQGDWTQESQDSWHLHEMLRQRVDKLARQIEQSGYTDTGARRGRGGRGTFIPAQIPVRLDYIWLRSDARARLDDAEIVEEPDGHEASDHRPVIAELALTTG